MASTINASTSGVGGVLTTADASGVLQLQSNAVTAVTVDATSASPVEIQRNGGANSNTSIRYKQASTSWYVGANPSNYFGFKYNDADLSASPLMVIDTNGNVGIGTSSPSRKFEVHGTPFSVGTDATGVLATFANNNTAYNASPTSAISLWNKINSSGAMFPSAVLQAGKENTTDANYAGYMSFITVTSAAVPTERMRIDSTGKVLINTTSTVGSTAWLNNKFNGASQTGIAIQNTNASNTGTFVQFFNSASAQIGTISQNGASAVAYNTSSDYRLKENIIPMIGALQTVAALKPVTYTWKIDGTDGQGFIAHELQEVVPDCVTGEKDAVDAEGNPVYQGIDTSFLVATLTAAIQELKVIIDMQAERIAVLENKIV